MRFSRHTAPKRSTIGSKLLLICSCLLGTGPAVAEIATDGTVGPIRGLSGAMIIDEGLGTRAGDNLFHSFRLFNIATGESATFTGAPNIANVISRVTGGSASTIDGLLKSEIGHAGFFMINPAGVVFGPNAKVDVPGAFHVGTADRVNFPDGYYSATDTAGSTLSLAAPESFGFLARQAPADIKVSGSEFAFEAGETASFVGGNVQATIDWGTFSFARISSAGGDIRVIAVGAPDAESRVAFADGSSSAALEGEVGVSWGAEIDARGAAGPRSIALAGGTVDVSYYSWLNARHSGDNDSAGTIRIDADSISIADSEIDAGVSGQDRPASIELEATGNLRIARSTVSADNLGHGSTTAPMQLRAKEIEIINSDVRSLVSGAGSGADIEVSADSLTIDAGSAADGFSRLRTRVLKGATGTAGDIRITAERVALIGGGQISSIVDEGGGGTGGNLRLEVGGSLVADGFNINAGSPVHSGMMTTVLSADGIRGGDIIVLAPDAALTLANGALIQAGTAGGGDSGHIDFAVRSFSADGSWIFAPTMGAGAAGDVHIEVAESLTLRSGASIESWSWPEGAGSAGTVSLEVGGNLTLDDGKIDTSTSSEQAAGDLSLNVAGTFDMTAGSWLDSSTYASGVAGGTEIRVGGAITLAGGASINAYAYSLDRRDAGRLGDAGRIDIEADSLNLVDSSLDVTSNTAANAGVIDITTRADVRLDSTGTIGSSRAGLRAGNTAPLSSPPFDPALVANQGRSGDIRLAARNIVLDHDSLIDISTARGNGGTVRVAAESLSLLNGASINAFGRGPGRGGDVRIALTGTLAIAGKDAEGLTSAGITTSSLELGPHSPATHLGAAGAIDIEAQIARIGYGGQILSESFSSAPSGDIDLRVGRLEVVDGGGILAGAGGTGAAGDIYIEASEQIRVAGISPDLLTASKIFASAGFGTERGQGISGNILLSAPDILIESGAEISSELGSGGLPGTLSVHADRLTVRTGGVISASTYAEGGGGLVDIRADTVTLDGSEADTLPALRRETGVFSKSALTTGDAGTIRLAAGGRVDILNGAELSTSTSAGGRGGNIRLDAGSLYIDAATLASRAESGATGFAGNIDITAGLLDLRNGGEISIAALQTVPEERLATVPDSRIRIKATELRMTSGAAIGAESTGNVPAGAIDIAAADTALTDLSRITTESTNADGGPIAIAAHSLWLTDSLITTSVQGAAGDGGDIAIRTHRLGMNGGFIQANTAAQDAEGGDIAILANEVSLSRGFVQIGGNDRLRFRPGLGLNVIQAAAPAGVQGNISTTVPQLDVTEGLAELATPIGDPAALVHNRCLAGSPLAGSSLLEQSVAGIPPGPAAPATVSFAGERLDRLLAGGR